MSQPRLRVILGAMEMGRGLLTKETPVSLRVYWATPVLLLFFGGVME